MSLQSRIIYERGIKKLGFGYMLDGVWYWTATTTDTLGGDSRNPIDLRTDPAFAWRVVEALAKHGSPPAIEPLLWWAPGPPPGLGYMLDGAWYWTATTTDKHGSPPAKWYAIMETHNPADALYAVVCALGRT